ncbi:MAG TPA: hypothetical protein PL017_12290 [Tenuifilaceae bacterium]|nr:hypothetical protein [Tenuifilaceae bacterium]HPE18294.1 hypothetical protein [Tenuifilaceae bacterium]HPJ46870.1 hypothetical protein [Tenuifilaceae bacterium]HPQ34617.1 hypothetical protein [Tenuifilaceae bacterium]HRX68947.1 hypothetical protein [Tenuifilaceae bacterium]
MRKQIHKLTFLLAFLLVTIVSCNKTEEPEPLNKEEAVEVLNSLGTEMGQTMGEMMASPSMVALTNFMFLMNFGQENPEMALLPSAIESIVKLDAGQVKQIPSKLMLDDDGMGILDSLGTFTWNFTTYSWDYSQEPADKLIYIFPSTPESTENDATLTISNFEFVTSLEDIFPVSFEVSLVVETEEILSLSYIATVNEAELSGITLELIMAPFDFNLNLAITIQSNGALVAFNHEFKKDGVKIMSSNIEVLMEGMTSFNIFNLVDEGEDESEDDEEEPLPAYVRGFFQFGQVKAQLDLLTKDYLLALTDESSPEEQTSAANANLKITLYTYPQGAEIGDIVWQWDSEEESIVPYILFSDGTTQPLYDFFPEGLLEEFVFD